MMRFVVHIKLFYETKVCIICNKTNFLLNNLPAVSSALLMSFYKFFVKLLVSDSIPFHFFGRKYLAEFFIIFNL